MKKMVACVVAASLLLLAMTAMQINPERLRSESIFVEDESAGVDEQALYDELFDLNSTVQIDVDIAKDEIAKIQQDYQYYLGIKSKSPIFRKAKSVTFTINGQKYVIEEVGIRMKGNSTRSNFYDDVLGIYNNVHFKLCFNSTFEEGSYYSLDAKEWPDEAARQKRLARTFATLQRMELKWNSTADNTYARTIYTHEMFRSYGIPTQRCTLVDFRIGGCRMGLYRLFEPVDEIFLRRNLPEEDWGGDLYKVRCTDESPANYLPDNTYGICSKNRAEWYNFDLKTNQDKSLHASMRHLLEVVNQPDVTQEELESVADVKMFALFNAINQAVGNQDDLRYNYNNHYLYFRKSDGKAIFIPYDCEVCLGDVYSWNPSGDALTGQSPYAEFTFRSPLQQNGLVRQTVLEDGCFVDIYTDALRDICGSEWLTEAHFRKYYNVLESHYGDRVISPYSFMSTLHMNTAFSMEGGEACNGNMAIGDFMIKMRENLLQYV